MTEEKTTSTAPENKVQTEDKGEVYLTRYQEQLVKAWNKNHTNPAPLMPNGQGGATWANRHQRRRMAKLYRKAQK